MSRPFYRFTGIAYKNVLKESQVSSRVTADLNSRKSMYNDNAIRLSEKDLKDFNGIDGKPICLEHRPHLEVGKIHHHWIDDEGNLRISGRIFTDSKDGQRMAEEVRCGNFRGLSVGYDAFLDDHEVLKKEFHEISLCKEPFFEGCQVKVTACKKNKVSNF